MAQPTSSWIAVSAGSDFPIQNIPFGVCVPAAGGAPRCCSAIGDTVVDLAVLAEAGLFEAPSAAALKEATLNAFMALGRPAWVHVRARLQALLAAEDYPGADPRLRTDAALQARALLPRAAVRMCLPATIGDYTDFYSSRDHAYNVGVMIRGPENALQPNWSWLPVGYHGRSSSVVVSGTPFKRPCGQAQLDPANPAKGASYGPSKRMDFELEMGTWVGPGTALGDAVDAAHAEDHIFGMCLMNDWSARDIQTWEYVPLGPFGSKNFCTTVSPWVVTLEALEPFRCATSSGEQTPAPLPYLVDPRYGSYDVQLEVALTPAPSAASGAAASSAEPSTAPAPAPAPVDTVLTRSNYKHMYWNLRQQLAHHTVTGCNMRPGDLLGSGTISGPTPDARGCLLELTWKGEKPIPLAGGAGQRVFLQDHDTVTMRGWCEKDGVRIGFGECVGTMLPATPLGGK